MIYLWATLLVVCNALCVLSTLLLLPGNIMMACLTVAVAWWQWDRGMFSIWTLVAVVALALGGEVLEFFSSAVGARRSGGTRWGSFGALLGALLGAVFGTMLIPVPVLGSLVGMCGGAFGGAWVFEAAGGKKARASARTAMGAGAGRLAGVLIKLAVGVVIWAIVAVAAYWP